MAYQQDRESRQYVESPDQLTESNRVWVACKLKPEHVAAIVKLGADNLDVVLTQPRWMYIKSKPEARGKLLSEAIRAIVDPDEVHRDRHPENVIYYRRLGHYYLKVLVWLQFTKTDKQHSIGDWYLKRANQVKRDVQGLIWSKHAENEAAR